MSIARTLVRYFLTLPGDLIVWLIVALIRALWGSSLGWQNGVLFVVLKGDSWPMRTWYRAWGGTTFGHAVMLAPGQDNVVRAHELIHVEQIEANSFVGFVVGLLLACLGWWWLGLLLWPLVPAIAYGGASLVSWLRAEPDAYVGNLYERSARALSGQECSKP